MNRREVATSLVDQRPKSSAFFQQATPERWPHAKGRSAVTRRGESPPRTPSTSVTIPRHEDRKRVHRSLRGQLEKTNRGSDRPQHLFLLLRTLAGNRGPKTAHSRQKCRPVDICFSFSLERSQRGRVHSKLQRWPQETESTSLIVDRRRCRRGFASTPLIERWDIHCSIFGMAPQKDAVVVSNGPPHRTRPCSLEEKARRPSPSRRTTAIFVGSAATNAALQSAA